MESRGLRVNLGETEVMIKYVNQDPILHLANTHVEFVVRVLVLTPSFAMTMLTEYMSNGTG